jgi:hypothetical protein
VAAQGFAYVCDGLVLYVFNINQVIREGPDQAINYLKDDSSFKQHSVSQQTSAHSQSLVVVLDNTDFWRISDFNVFLLTISQMFSVP